MFVAISSCIKQSRSRQKYQSPINSTDSTTQLFKLQQLPKMEPEGRLLDNVINAEEHAEAENQRALQAFNCVRAGDWEGLSQLWSPRMMAVAAAMPASALLQEVRNYYYNTRFYQFFGFGVVYPYIWRAWQQCFYERVPQFPRSEYWGAWVNLGPMRWSILFGRSLHTPPEWMYEFLDCLPYSLPAWAVPDDPEEPDQDEDLDNLGIPEVNPVYSDSDEDSEDSDGAEHVLFDMEGDDGMDDAMSDQGYVSTTMTGSLVESEEE